MKNIFNLIIYVGIIFLLIQLCNNMTKEAKEAKEAKETNNKTDERFTVEQDSIKGNPTIYFDYDTVPIEPDKEHIEDRYQKELKTGAIVNPQYSNDNFTDQRSIYNNDMYTKPIHTNRTLDAMGENDLPKTIAQIFDESITDFKKLTPNKQSQTGDFVIQGASKLTTFNRDDFVYDDEKPENGAVFSKDDKYKGNLSVYGYDNMVSLESSLF
jgi:hypothetical protein